MLITRASGVMGESRYHLALLAALDPLTDRAVVIVPEQYTLQAERDLLQALHCEGLFHIEVLSFKRLWHQWAKHLGMGDVAVLSDLGKKMLLRQVLKSLDGSLVTFRGNYRNKGFIAELSDLIGTLRVNRVFPQLLEALINKAQLQGEPSKLRELAMIFKAYSDALGTDLVDESYWVDRVIEGIQKFQPAQKSLFVVEGFSSMTQQEIDLLSALRGHASNMALRIVDSEGDSVCFRHPKGLYRKLVHTFTQDGWAVETKVERVGETPCAKYFRESFDGGFQGTVKQIHLGSARDKEEELSAVFYQMVEYHQSGTPWEAMAVLTTQLEGYALAAKRLAQSFEVPCFIDIKRPATSHYAIDFILSSLKAIATNYRPDWMLKVLKAGLILPMEALWTLENFSVSKGIRGRMWLQDWTLFGADQSLEGHRHGFIRTLETLRQDLQAAETGKDKVVALRSYLLRVSLFEGLASQVAQLKDQGLFERAEEMAQVHNIIDQVLYQVYSLGNDEMTLETMMDLVQLGFDSYEIAIIPPFQHYVTFGNIQRTRLQDLEYIFFVGVTEGALPSREAPRGILSESELQWLIEQGLTQLPPPLSGYDEEVYKTYEHLLRVRGDAYWSYPRATSEGMPLKASLWFNQLLDGGQVEAQLEVSLDQLKAAALRMPYLDLTLKQLAAHMTGDLGSQLSESALASALSGLKGLAHSEDVRFSRAVAGFFSGASYMNTAKALPRPLTRSLYGEVMKTSVTRLESFSKCPYQHFATYGLRPQILNTQDLSGLDMGDLFHGVFEQMLNRMQGEAQVKDLEQWDWALDFEVIFDAVCKANERFRYSPRNEYFKGRLKSVVKRAVGFAIDHIRTSEFQNHYNELTFGLGLSAHAPALTIETKHGDKIYLEGKIDRIDAYSEGETCFVSIVDYKSSKQSLDLVEIYHGLKLQLMLYLDVAVENGKLLFGKTSRPFGAFYFKVDEPTVSPKDPEGELVKEFRMEGLYQDDLHLVQAMDPAFASTGLGRILKSKLNKDGGLASDAQQVPEDALNTIRHYAREKAKGIAESLFEGHISIAPVVSGDTDACVYCAYKAICHFDSKKRNQKGRQLQSLSSQEIISKMEAEIQCRGHQSKSRP